MNDYRAAYQRTRERRRSETLRLPEGLRVRRSERSSLDTPSLRFFKWFFAVIIGLGGLSAVVLFILSFLSGESAPKEAVYYKEKGYQRVQVQIGYKADSNQSR